MEWFVRQDSIVRKIWGKSDTVLFIFAGSAAEFALNKAVDWLYFTGRLPADPLGRLFSTVAYARQIIFSQQQQALRAIDSMSHIHAQVEKKRGAQIPAWAYRDVLFMLIHYSIASYELLERKLSAAEKEEVYEVFYRVGLRMQLEDLPLNYNQWVSAREIHLNNNLIKSEYTKDLFKQYKKHLGTMRFTLLKEVQIMLAPPKVLSLLGFRKTSWVRPVLSLYKLSRVAKMDALFKFLLLPEKYKPQIKQLDINFVAE